MLGAAGCASHTSLPPDQRGALERALTGRHSEQFLRLSFFITPFFGDASKRLLTASPPEEVRLLERPGGAPVNPGPVQAVVPAGARARVTRVEFPTAFAVAERVIFTPRTQPWVFLEVEGAPPGPPLVLVLRPHLRSQDEFRAELERYLVPEDPSPRMEAWGRGIVEAVKAKRAQADMGAEALEAAWGYPETKRITFEASERKEEWIYPGSKRKAWLTEGRVVRVEEGAAP